MAAGEPQRTCVACRVTRGKGSLLRVVRDPSGALVVGASAGGRGAYMCRDRACIAEAMQPGRLERALRARIPRADLARLGEQLIKGEA